MENEGTRKRLAIFIDLNNVEFSIGQYREAGMILDYGHLIKTVSEGYDLQYVKVYDSIPSAGNDHLMELHRGLRESGMELILKRPQAVEYNMKKTCEQKEVDTSLVVDVVSGAYEDLFDVAMIISGDRDMRPAGECLQRIGKEAIYAAFYDVFCPELRDLPGSIILEDLYVLQASGYNDDPECRSTVSQYAVSEEGGAAYGA